MTAALTIAGSDSSGGAGVQADIKTFAALGVHGTSVITSVTAQNSVEIQTAYNLPVPLIEKQLECLTYDISIDAAKTGMLSNREIVTAVSNKLADTKFPLVVDPVMASESGFNLLDGKGISAVKKHLLPIAFLVTPNISEAEILAEIPINTHNDIREAANIIRNDTGCESVLIKGGHFKSDYAIDTLYYKKKYFEFKSKKIPYVAHGTGCSLSAAITANLAKGYTLKKAVNTAKEFIEIAIKYSYKTGKGPAPVNPCAWVEKEAIKGDIAKELQAGMHSLSTMDISSNVPEVGMNLAYALPKPFAISREDIAAIDGRITKTISGIRYGSIKFGASSHLSQALLTIMEKDASIRAIMNIKYDEKIISDTAIPFSSSSYDRKNEPTKTKSKEGKTMSWGIAEALKKSNVIPDIIYHKGDFGKEPMILLLGKNPEDIISKLRQLINRQVK